MQYKPEDEKILPSMIPEEAQKLREENELLRKKISEKDRIIGRLLLASSFVSAVNKRYPVVVTKATSLPRRSTTAQTSRLDEEREQLLKEIREKTGMRLKRTVTKFKDPFESGWEEPDENEI